MHSMHCARMALARLRGLRFPVSGGAFSSIRIFALAQSGPAWLTGGNFGPEGGALSTVVLLVTIAVLLKYDLFNTKSEVS